MPPVFEKLYKQCLYKCACVLLLIVRVTIVRLKYVFNQIRLFNSVC
ncbi:hypothetical protein [Caudoviricetes sp.]|nr:hypothetical protein [Caudoviricetes sp.]